MVIKIQTTEDRKKINLKRDGMTIKVQNPVQTRNHAHDVENHSIPEFEIMVVEPKVEKPLKRGVERVKSKMNEENRINTTQAIKKIDIRQDLRSHQIKALKALVLVENQIINMTIDSGSPVLFLKWTTAKQFWMDHPKSNFFQRKN